MERLTVYRTPILTLDPNAKAGGGMVEVVKLADHQQTVERLERERDTARKRVDELEAREVDVCVLRGEIADLQAQLAAANEGIQASCKRAKGHLCDLIQAEQQVAQLRDAHRDFGVHLSHCNFGEHENVCKYGKEETCPALTESWAWFGKALQRLDALQTAHTTLRGLVREIKEEFDSCTYECERCGFSNPLTTFDIYKTVCEAAAIGNTLLREGGGQEDEEERKHKQWESDMFCDEKAGWEYSKMNPRNTGQAEGQKEG